MTAPPDRGTVLAILDEARWAPSGDNTQVWRFELAGPGHVVVHGRRIGERCVYDLEGHASLLALGALLETLRLAAAARGVRASWTLRPDAPWVRPTFDVRLEADPGISPDPLAGAIRRRSVRRTPMRPRPPRAAHRRALEASLPEGYRVRWIGGWAGRARMALLYFRSAWIRLTIEEAWREHREVIRWGRRHSEWGIPDRALGVDPLLRAVMRWALASWRRVDRLNRWLAGTWWPRIEMDLLPGLLCGAHFALLAPHEPERPEDHAAAGVAVQRFWLAATRCGLRLQPQTTPLIFAAYARRGIAFATRRRALERAREVAARLEGLLGPEGARRAVFLGRLGYGRPARARSLRLPLEALLVDGPPRGAEGRGPAPEP